MSLPETEPEVRDIVNPTKYCNWALCSTTDKSGLLVGEYPKESTYDVHLKLLLEAGVTVFVNLCTTQEKKKHGDYEALIRVKHPSLYPKLTFINLPFLTKKVPDETKLYDTSRKVFDMCNDEGKLVYVHSVTGHGRCTVFAGFCMMFDPTIRSTNRPIEILEHSLMTREIKVSGKSKLESRDQYKIFERFPELLRSASAFIKEPHILEKEKMGQHIRQMMKDKLAGSLEPKEGETLEELVKRTAELSPEECAKLSPLSGDEDDMPSLTKDGSF